MNRSRAAPGRHGACACHPSGGATAVSHL